MQLMYDKSSITEPFRARCALTLGLWHNYKQVSYTLYRAYADELFAPMLHFFFPNSHFYTKPKLLSIVQTAFTQVRLAYPTIRDELTALLRSQTLKPAIRQYAQNLQDLCEFFIPAVSVSHFVFKFTYSLKLIINLYSHHGDSQCICLY